ncbi:hypothetical protein Tco_1094044 [Tanacetum coccineum]|uniref:Uncharacterized protein n=1 Tax=Tanacetum coccineum TaxID=301880 RepID=A0ABQ5IEE9_9ASTR
MSTSTRHVDKGFGLQVCGGEVVTVEVVAGVDVVAAAAGWWRREGDDEGDGGDDVDCGVDGVVTDGVMMAAAGVVFAGGWPDSGDGAGFNERRGRSEDEHE